MISHDLQQLVGFNHKVAVQNTDRSQGNQLGGIVSSSLQPAKNMMWRKIEIKMTARSNPRLTRHAMRKPAQALNFFMSSLLPKVTAEAVA